MPHEHGYSSPRETTTQLSHPVLDKIYKEISHIAPFLDLGNPVVLLLALFLSKKIMDGFNNASHAVTEALWFSQKKDAEIAGYLQLLRETTSCDRVVLGLIVNGETSIGNNYHLRKLVITHESCGANISSAIKGKESRISLAVLAKETALYTPEKDWTAATIETADLDKNCRRYLDSIDCHTIFTNRLTHRVMSKEVDLGYLSLQWTSKPDISFLDRDSINWMLEHRLGKDLTFYTNKVITTILSSNDRRKLFTQINKLLTWKSPQT